MNDGLDSHSDDRHKESMTCRLNRPGQLSKKHIFLQYIFHNCLSCWNQTISAKKLNTGRLRR